MLGPDLKVYALKKVSLKKLDRSSLANYENEIALLKRLRGVQHMIQMYDHQLSRERKSLFVVMESGEIDLNHRLRDYRKRAAERAKKLGWPWGEGNVAAPGEVPSGVDENFIRVSWQAMLEAVHTIRATVLSLLVNPELRHGATIRHIRTARVH